MFHRSQRCSLCLSGAGYGWRLFATTSAFVISFANGQWSPAVGCLCHSLRFTVDVGYVDGVSSCNELEVCCFETATQRHFGLTRFLLIGVCEERDIYESKEPQEGRDVLAPKSAQYSPWQRCLVSFPDNAVPGQNSAPSQQNGQIKLQRMGHKRSQRSTLNFELMGLLEHVPSSHIQFAWNVFSFQPARRQTDKFDRQHLEQYSHKCSKLPQPPLTLGLLQLNWVPVDRHIQVHKERLAGGLKCEIAVLHSHDDGVSFLDSHNKGLLECHCQHCLLFDWF